MHLSLSGELQQIHRGRVLGLGQLEEHAGEPHFYATQANKLRGSEQCGFPSTLATQAGSFAAGHCLALLITRLAGCGSSVGSAVLLAVKGTTTLERGGAPWVLQMPACLCWSKAVPWPVWTVNCGGLAEGMVYTRAAWVDRNKSDYVSVCLCPSVCAGITTCD